MWGVDTTSQILDGIHKSGGGLQLTRLYRLIRVGGVYLFFIIKRRKEFGKGSVVT